MLIFYRWSYSGWLGRKSVSEWKREQTSHQAQKAWTEKSSVVMLFWDLFQYIKGCSLLSCNIHILGHCSKNKMEVCSSLPSFKSAAFSAALDVTFPWRKHLSGSGCLLYVWGEHRREGDAVRPSARTSESTCVTTGSLSSQRRSFHIERWMFRAVFFHLLCFPLSHKWWPRGQSGLVKPSWSLKVCLQGGGVLQREQLVYPLYSVGVGDLACSIPCTELSDLTSFCM